MASIFKQRYTAKGKDGKRIRKQSKCWYVDYKTSEGTRKRVKGFKDKAATTQLAAQLEKEAEQAQIGIVDKYKDHRSKPLLEHLEDFKQSLLDKGNTKDHARLTSNRIKAILDGCKFIFFADVSASKTLKYLAERRRQGLSIKSSNDYLQAIKQFCRWLVADRRMPDNPLAYLKGQNPQTDVRHERRALTCKELDAFLKYTLKAKKHHNLTGKERYMLYTLALTTGFRAKELASLTWRSLDLNDSKPSITVVAIYAKNRREVTLPLRKDIAGRFRQWFTQDGFSQQDKIFPKFNESKGAEMLRKDLEAVGIPYQDESGRYADFHSLRHSFASILHQSGVSPKVAQALLRHSTISLTMDTYTHIGLYDERAAIDSLQPLPGLEGDESNQNKAVALGTGTDNLPVKTDESAYKPAYKKLAKNAYFDSQQPSSIGKEYRKEGERMSQLPSGDNHLSTGELDTDFDAMSTVDTPQKDNGPGWIRTSVGLRQRVYSPSPLASRAPTHFILANIQ